MEPSKIIIYSNSKMSWMSMFELGLMSYIWTKKRFSRFDSGASSSEYVPTSICWRLRPGTLKLCLNVVCEWRWRRLSRSLWLNFVPLSKDLEGGVKERYESSSLSCDAKLQCRSLAIAIVRQNDMSTASCRVSWLSCVSRQIWCIQVADGRPLARLHSCEGRSPSLALVQIRRMWFAVTSLRSLATWPQRPSLRLWTMHETSNRPGAPYTYRTSLFCRY